MLSDTKSQTIRTNIRKLCKMIPIFLNPNIPKSISALNADESHVLDHGSTLRTLPFDFNPVNNTPAVVGVVALKDGGDPLF